MPTTDPDRTEPRHVDAVVVGGGPAGLAAALWLGRYRRRTVVLDSGEYRNASVVRAHGYLGLDPVDPSELRDMAWRQLERYATIERAQEIVRSVSGEIDNFTVESERRRWTARRIVLACGVRDRFPEVPGFFDHYGTDIFHCPACDGYEARGKPVIVFGWSEHIAGFARSLLEWAESVTVVTDGRPFEGDDADRRALDTAGIAIVEDDAIGFEGSRGDLRGVLLRRRGALPCRLAFFSIEHDPRNDLAVSLGCVTTEEGCVVVDAHGRTSVDGVYAGGDLTPAQQLIQVAAASGAVAGIACARSLA